MLAQNSFENTTVKSNLNHKHIAPNLMGGGIAIIDYNNDGFEDIYLTGGVYEDHLFKNNGDKTFTDITTDFGIYDFTRTIQTTGVISGDINNDGYEDLFVTTVTGKANILLLNKEGKSFENISSIAGITKKSWSMGASFGDYNSDGFLDIYVINYIKNPSAILDENNEAIGFDHVCYPNFFYINQGNSTFLELADELNVDSEGCGLAVAFSDVNNDSKSDIYIANDFGEWIEPNVFYQNEYPKENFLNNSISSKLNVPMYGMGIGVGDVNNDGLLDYYVTNIGKNALLQQIENYSFENITDYAGVGNEKINQFNSTGWGVEIFDFDHDGFEDIYVSNGYIPAASFLETTEEDPNKLYKNMGEGKFIDVTNKENLVDNSIGRGVVTFDYDNDGDLDLLTSNINILPEGRKGVQLLENKIGNQKNWLKVKLKGDKANNDGLGARISCFYNRKIWVDEISGGASHASKKSNFAHFGLNDIEKIDSIVVKWPGGFVQSFKNVDTNQYIMISETNQNIDIIGCMEDDNEFYNSKATISMGCLIEEVIADLDDDLFQSNFLIFPNPAQKTLTFKFDSFNKEEVVIYDQFGRIKMRNEIRSMEELNVSHLTIGTYIVYVGNKFRQKIAILD